MVGLERRGVERRLKEFEVSRKVLVDNKVVEKTVVIKVDQAAVHKGEGHKVRGKVSCPQSQYCNGLWENRKSTKNLKERWRH